MITKEIDWDWFSYWGKLIFKPLSDTSPKSQIPISCSKCPQFKEPRKGMKGIGSGVDIIILRATHPLSTLSIV